MNAAASRDAAGLLPRTKKLAPTNAQPFFPFAE
jgi:hypothetical protein